MVANLKMKPWKNWRYVLLPGKNPGSEFRNLYESAFNLWHGEWSETFGELGVGTFLYSDDFTRQDCVGGVFDGNDCLMLSFFRYVDMSDSSARLDSYFRFWNSQDILELTRDSSQIIVASNVTLSKQVRGKALGLSMKDLMMNLLVEYGRHSYASAETGTTRNSKSMNRVASDAGAQLLRSGVMMHGVDSDIYTFNMKDLRDHVNEWTPIVEYLWRHRVEAYRGLENTQDRIAV